MKLTVRRCHLIIKFPWYSVAQHRELHSLLFNEIISGKHGEKAVGLSGLALKSSHSNCLVLILHRQVGNCLLGTCQCLPVNYSDQLQPTSPTGQSQAQEMISSQALNQPTKGSRDNVIPGSCAANMTHIRTCTSPAELTSREAEDKQGAEK